MCIYSTDRNSEIVLCYIDWISGRLHADGAPTGDGRECREHISWFIMQERCHARDGCGISRYTSITCSFSIDPSANNSELYGLEDGTIPATFQVTDVTMFVSTRLSCAHPPQIVYMLGWKPHPSQQQPLRRGCGTKKVGELS